MDKFYSLYNKLFLEQDKEDDEEVSDKEVDEETPEGEEPEEEVNPDGDEEFIKPPEIKDHSDVEAKQMAQDRVEDMAEKISDEMLTISMDKFDIFRKVLKKKGLTDMVDDFVDNIFSRRQTSKVDSLFIDLYAADVKELTAEKLKQALTDLSLGKDIEEEPVPEKEDEVLWTP